MNHRSEEEDSLPTTASSARAPIEGAPEITDAEALSPESPAASGEPRTPAETLPAETGSDVPDQAEVATLPEAPANGTAEPVGEAPVAEEETPAEPVEEAPVAEAETPAEPVEEAPVAEAETPAEPVEEAPVAEGETPAEPVGEAPVAEGKTPAEPVGEAPVAEGETPAEPVGEAPVAEGETPAEPVEEAPVAEAETPADPDAKTPVADGAAAAALLTQAVESQPKAVIPKKGARISGTIVRIGEDGAFVDFGGREEGFLDVRDLQDEKGNLTKKIGDKIQASVVAVEGGIKLSTKRGRRSGNLAAVLEAHRNHLPVEGKVTGVNKGGLVVHAMGVRAFCPFSQIDRHYIDNPSEYVGKRLTFRVSSADERGKNVVLSRRAVLEESVRERATELRKQLEVGQEHTGVVARIRPFGAFVDLGGVDGLVHVSEISHARIKDPSEALKVGETVKVRILKIEDMGGKKERISLSVKQLMDDPWETVARELTVGGKVEGKIVRIVEFGAFLSISPGVDGLIHVSALAMERVNHPGDIVEVGQTVEAWVLSVDASSRRISLSLVDPSDRVERPTGKQRGRGGPRRKEGREPSEPRAEPRSADTGMTSMEEAFQRLRDRNSGS